MKRATCGVLFVATLVGAVRDTAAGELDLQTPKRRRPVALAVAQSRLYSANQQSGSISVLDLGRLAVEREVVVGKSLSDLMVIGEDRLIATDQQRHEWILLEIPSLRVLQRTPVARSPVSIQINPAGTQLSIASLWSRRVTIFNRSNAGSLRDEWTATQRIDLTFSPREQWISPSGDHLVVADAFGGQLAIIDPAQGHVISQRSIAGHNLHGLATALDGKSLLVTHQILNGQATTTRDMVFWGSVIGNVLRGVTFDELFDSRRAGSPVAHWTLLPLGGPGDATGDPDAIVLTSTGKTAVALAGVDQVAISSAPRSPMLRLAVGRRPVDLALSPDEQRLFVCNMLDDTISVIELATLRVAAVVALGPTPPMTLADHGERHFYDARLSLDGWYSCHSCHTDGHSNGLLNDNLGDGSFGAPKRVPSLLGTGNTGPWAWYGTQSKLTAQIHKSITATMRGPVDESTDDVSQAIAHYLESLPPAVSLDQAREIVQPLKRDRGRVVFTTAGCADCHAPPFYTSADAYDVELSDERGHRTFNPPSLLGVSQRARLFHDGRAIHLEEVLTDFQHGGADRLPEHARRNLLKFLQSL